MVPQPGFETGSATYKAAASPQCFRGNRVIKIDKRTALPLRIPEKRGRLHEAPSSIWTFTMSNSKSLSSPYTRARSRRAHARIVSSFDARAAAIAGAPAHERFMSVAWLSVSSRAHRVPPACVAEGFWPVRRLVRLS